MVLTIFIFVICQPMEKFEYVGSIIHCFLTWNKTLQTQRKPEKGEQQLLFTIAQNSREKTEEILKIALNKRKLKLQRTERQFIHHFAWESYFSRLIPLLQNTLFAACNPQKYAPNKNISKEEIKACGTFKAFINRSIKMASQF